MLRIGVATADGRGETVIGLVQMLAGENALDVATRARAAVEALQPSLPKGVRIVPYYDRAAFVRRVIRTVEINLLEGSLLVVAVLFAFLGNIRAGLIVASAIPLSMLLAFAGMVQTRISANLMSLGAIDFGLISIGREAEGEVGHEVTLGVDWLISCRLTEPSSGVRYLSISGTPGPHPSAGAPSAAGPGAPPPSPDRAGSRSAGRRPAHWDGRRCRCAPTGARWARPHARLSASFIR